MKKLIFTIAIIIASLSVSAQTAGILVQPEFSTSNTRRGFFAQADVFKGVGVYGDFKFMNNDTEISEVISTQVNAGLTLKVYEGLRLVVATSLVNKERSLFIIDEPATPNLITKRDIDRSYQFGAMYSAGMFSVLGAYETGGAGERITAGIGFNF